MKDDPIYLSEEASLGVLSVDGNFCRRILTEKYAKVKHKGFRMSTPNTSEIQIQQKERLTK